MEQVGCETRIVSCALDGCRECTCYVSVMGAKAQNATRKDLLVALRAIKQNNVARKYEQYLKTTVIYVVHISMYTCTLS